MIELSEQEQKLFKLLGIIDPITLYRSPTNQEFDLQVSYVDRSMIDAGVHTTAWIPLAAIKRLICWTHESVARMTQYPQMTMDGDWSGVRDSNMNQIWMIFHKFVVPLLS